MQSKKAALSIVVSVTLLLIATVASAKPKYVFFFLGDGMSATQIQTTEAFLTTVNADSSIQDIAAREASELLKPENRLNMSKMSVTGMQTTYDAHALMTDSASSATAFACGLKTVSGTIGMDDAKTVSYKSVAQLAHEAGMNVGILSSVSLDHATPAAYYASVASRSSYDLIDIQLGESGYEFFGGGGLKVAAPDGYTVLNTHDDIVALKENPMEKVICINPWLQDSAAMPYDIDRLNSDNDNLSLAEMTEVAIENLYGLERNKKHRKHGKNGKEGFFIMVEGGKIDWACHANDAVATIGDMLDFDKAVGKALEFYQEHPMETLIVVTGDHETGGLTIGHATTAYKAYYDKLLNQTNSFQYFGENQWPAHKDANNGVCGSHIGVDNLAGNTDMLSLMEDVFGLDYDDLNEYQKEKLEDAYDKSLCGSNDNSDSENKYLYGGYNPIIVTITHILNENASIGWTSYSHTGVPVPVFAEGKGAKAFANFYDNTDIAKKLAEVMGVGTLPAVK